MPDSHLLPTGNLTLSRRDDGVLLLTRDAQTTPLATPKRALPLSDPDKFIVLCDEDGQEIGVLRDVNELDAVSQEVLREALNRAYTITRITRVLEVEREALTGQTRWRVEIESDAAANETEEITTVLEQLDPVAPGDAPRATPSAALNGSSAATPTSFMAKPGFAANDGDSDGSEKDDTKMLGRLRRRLRQDKSDDEDTVDTEEREFLISGQEDVQTARYPHIYIVDTERNRYEIPDCEALDLESRRAAERFF